MTVQIKTDDQEIIKATIYNQKGGLGVIIIASAMGVHQKYYKHVANYLVNLGYVVLSFDYRGIGESSFVRNSKNCTLSNWGARDLSAVIQFCEEQFADKLIYLLGHSISGQIFPFAMNKNKVKRAYFVASQNLSKKYWTGKHKLIVSFFWHVVLPVFNNLFNGLPGFAFGGNQKLPKLVAREWASWGKSKDGAEGFVPKGEFPYMETVVPTKFISFDDDRLLAPKKAVQTIFQSYGSKLSEHEHIIPEALDRKDIGHFGFYRKSMENFWPDIHEWFSKAS